MEKKDTLKVQETVSRIPEGLADAKDAEQKGITGEKGSAAKGGEASEPAQNEDAGAEALKPGKDTAGEAHRKKGSGRLRMALGIAIMLFGVCVCLYPFYRQKKSDDFNKDAINMILTPQPTGGGFIGGQDQAPTKVPESTQGANVVPTLTEPVKEPDGREDKDGEEGGSAMLGMDLLENPDAPDQETEEEKENANRLNGQTVIGVIQIPKIELIYAIVEGADSAEIGVAIGHMDNTANLGENGNCALAGHRGGYSGPYFKNLDKLEIGDEVIITDTKQQVFTYKVTETMVVQPEEVWVIEDTGEGVAMLTLVTCENDGKERLIVRCVIP